MKPAQIEAPRPGAQQRAVPPGPPDEKNRTAWTWRALTPYAAALSFLGFALYAQTLNYAFVYDDDAFILLNESIRSLKNTALFFTEPGTLAHDQQLAHDNYRPIVTLSFAVNYALGGANPFGYRLVNLLLHLLNACFVFLLFLKLRQTRDGPAPNPLPAFLAAAVFLAHPVQVESVVFTSSRSNLMSLAFFLGSFLLYIQERRKLWPLALFALALLSKEMVIVLPALLWLWEIYFCATPGKKDRWLSALWKTAPYFAMAAAYFGLRTMMLSRLGQSGYWGGTFYLTMITMSRGIAYYIKLMLAPYPLSLEYLFDVSRSISDPRALLSLLLIVSMLTLAWALRGRRPILSFAILFFFVGLGPVANIIPIKAVIQERFMYLSVIGFALAVGDLARLTGPRIINWPWPLLALCFITFLRSQDWRSHRALVSATLKTCPQSARMHYGLGRAYAADGEFDKAAGEFHIALSIDPSYDEASSDLGRLALQKGQTQEALANYRKTLQVKVDAGDALFNMGTAYLRGGDYKNAVASLERAVEIFKPKPGALGDARKDSAYVEARSNLAAAYAYSGSVEKAVNLCVELLADHPELIKTRYNLALYYRGMGLNDAAQKQLEAALKTKPDWTLARQALQELKSAAKPNAVAAPETALIPEVDPMLVKTVAEKFPKMGAKLEMSRGSEFEAHTLKAPQGTIAGFKSKQGYLGSSQSLGQLKPEEKAALEALTKRGGRGQDQGPSFFFPKQFGTVSIGFGGDYQVYMSPAGRSARKPAARLENGTLVYAGAYPKTDVLYALRPGEMEKMYFIHQKTAENANGFTYRLQGNENISEFKIQEGRLAVISSKTGSPVLELTPPLIFDSAGKTVPGRYEIKSEKPGSWLMTLSFDDSGLQYPVLIDPTWMAANSSQLDNFFKAESRVANDAFKGPGVDGVAARNNNHRFPVPHGDMLALAYDAKTRPLESPHHPLARKKGWAHSLSYDFQLADFFLAQNFFEGGEIGSDGVLNVLKSLLFGPALTPASPQFRAMDGIAHLGFLNDNVVAVFRFHRHCLDYNSRLREDQGHGSQNDIKTLAVESIGGNCQGLAVKRLKLTMKKLDEFLDVQARFPDDASQGSFGQFRMVRDNDRYCRIGYRFLENDMAASLPYDGETSLAKGSYRLFSGYGGQSRHNLCCDFEGCDERVRGSGTAQFAGRSGFQVQLDSFSKIANSLLHGFTLAGNIQLRTKSRIPTTFPFNDGGESVSHYSQYSSAPSRNQGRVGLDAVRPENRRRHRVFIHFLASRRTSLWGRVLPLETSLSPSATASANLRSYSLSSYSSMSNNTATDLPCWVRRTGNRVSLSLFKTPAVSLRKSEMGLTSRPALISMSCLLDTLLRPGLRTLNILSKDRIVKAQRRERRAQNG